MSRQSGHRVIVITLLLLAVSAIYLQADCTEKETFSFVPPNLASRMISSPGYTAVYRIHNDGPALLKVILKKPSVTPITVNLNKGEGVDIAKATDQMLALEPTGATDGSFQLILAK